MAALPLILLWKRCARLTRRLMFCQRLTQQVISGIIATGRIGHTKFLDATAHLFLRLQPAGPAVSAYIPPPEIPHLAQLQQAGILVPDAAFKFPIHWDIGVATGIWRDVKEVSVQRWKDVFVKSLRDSAVAQVPIAAGSGIVAGPLLPVVAGAPHPAILLLQQQLAKQQADHVAALIAIQAQMAAQAASHAAALAAVPAASCGSGGGPGCAGPAGGAVRLPSLYGEVGAGIPGCSGGGAVGAREEALGFDFCHGLHVVWSGPTDGCSPSGDGSACSPLLRAAAEDPETVASPRATLEL
ncbi:hypothetical protein CYMTET_31270 [Cymbomonas tetramitiformis]|uniref:Uncharacterized protein n=1 Tax=Cymbomonas tetramitiformis TaxID=36881 RepID=A0AAE0KT48_9CHLO|nr:hypothetical protein CYMTET_31270 [Cymbomonas tetramitiformis]